MISERVSTVSVEEQDVNFCAKAPRVLYGLKILTHWELGVRAWSVRAVTVWEYLWFMRRFRRDVGGKRSSASGVGLGAQKEEEEMGKESSGWLIHRGRWVDLLIVPSFIYEEIYE